MSKGEKLKILDLFSGIGGFSLGLERTGGFETVAFCEIDPFCRKVLKKHWPDVPIFEDITKLKAGDIEVSINLICGGYPCQPFSHAGKRQGAEDDRHLWPEMYRLVDEFRPTWFIGENVAGHVSMGLDSVLSDLENLNYTTRTFIIPACAVDAKHRRNRVWILGNSNASSQSSCAVNDEACGVSDVANAAGFRLQRRGIARGSNGRCQENGGANKPPRIGAAYRTPPLADAAGVHAQGQQEGPREGKLGGSSWWSPEPPVGRVANGVPRRVDRLRSLGNAVVPQIPEIIGNAILASEGMDI